MGDFNHLANCWKSKARSTEITQSRLLESCDENFLIKIPRGADEGRYSNKTSHFPNPSQDYEGLGCGKHKLEFRIFRGERNSRIPNHGVSRLGLPTLSEWHGMLPGRE